MILAAHVGERGEHLEPGQVHCVTSILSAILICATRGCGLTMELVTYEEVVCPIVSAAAHLKVALSSVDSLAGRFNLVRVQGVTSDFAFLQSFLAAHLHILSP